MSLRGITQVMFRCQGQV